MKQITKIALTGGPCAGKTSGISWIINYFTNKGYKVLIVSEAATESINGGAKPWEVSTVAFQTGLYHLIKSKERFYENHAKSLDSDKILIVCDRGSLDAEAYLSPEDKERWLEELGLTETMMMADYDAVFHLVTAAKGAEQFYVWNNPDSDDKGNNEARSESPELAAEIDDKTIAAWTGHSHLRIIDNSTDFDKKMLRLVTEIASFLGEPEPFEIEKKFLIEYPDINILESLPNCQKVEILQMYLMNNDTDEVRIRQRGDGNDFIYTKTTKKTITGLKRVEKEKNLSKEEYLKEMLNVDYTLNPIRKSRYCLSYLNTYIEIDIYPFWDKYAIMEIELAEEEDSYQIPDFIHVIKEVTEDESFKNAELARQSIKEAYLDGKIDCAHSCFKFMDKQCKNQKSRVDNAEDEYERMKKGCHFEDEMSLVDSSKEDVLSEKAKLDAYVDIKISMEKWWRKVRHEKTEFNQRE
ncbi:AAA family ATPase [Hungatella sp.]|uniref:AAA family ATPase n=1 Tax=Hungatella sp. TaxID=2613924 RepID=UPI003991B10A